MGVSWMRLGRVVGVGLGMVAAMTPGRVQAQALPTATRAIEISLFGAGAERSLRVSGASNTDVTAGVDIAFLAVHGLRPALELRGSYPVLKGDIAGEHEFLGGLRLAHPLAASERARFYGDLLFGRGQLDYYGAGLQVPGMNLFYTESHSTIASPGGGLEVDAGGDFSLRLDAQYERYGTPVTNGSAWATVVTVGVVYRLDFDRKWFGRR